MPRVPRLLTPQEASKTSAHRFAKRADGLRQIATRFGVRPYQVWLVWQGWTGDERGAGRVGELKRVALLPTPKLEDLSAVALDPRSGGVLPVGTVRLTRVSASLAADLLRGRAYPNLGDEIGPDVEFFYEVREDGRAGDNPIRERFRLAAEPMRRPGKVDWTILLERMSEDRARDGKDQTGEDR